MSYAINCLREDSEQIMSIKYWSKLAKMDTEAEESIQLYYLHSSKFAVWKEKSEIPPGLNSLNLWPTVKGVAQIDLFTL